MKLLDGSAERSIRVRDNVCSGSFLGSERRACRADSFAEDRAASGGGDGRLAISILDDVVSERVLISFSIVSIEGDVDCNRVLAKLI